MRARKQAVKKSTTATVKKIKAMKTTKTIKAKKKKPVAVTSKTTKLQKGEHLKKSLGTALALPSKAITQKQSKAQIYAEIAEIANVSKQDVKNVLAAISNLVERNLKSPKATGQFVIPGLGIKVRRHQKKATKAKMGRNPFTGEEMKISAKPARKSVKVSALKALKALIES